MDQGAAAYAYQSSLVPLMHLANLHYSAAKNIDGPDPMHETHNPIKGAAGDKTQGRDEHGNSSNPMFSSTGAIGSQFTSITSPS